MFQSFYLNWSSTCPCNLTCCICIVKKFHFVSWFIAGSERINSWTPREKNYAVSFYSWHFSIGQKITGIIFSSEQTEIKFFKENFCQNQRFYKLLIIRIVLSDNIQALFYVYFF